MARPSSWSRCVEAKVNQILWQWQLAIGMHVLLQVQLLLLGTEQ
jgi:hypothetical protein